MEIKAKDASLFSQIFAGLWIIGWSAFTASVNTSYSATGVTVRDPITDGTNARTGETTHGKQLGVNYQIKVSN